MDVTGWDAEQPQLDYQVLPIRPQPQLNNNQQPNNRGQQPAVNQPAGMENQPAPALRYRGVQDRQIDDKPPKGLKYDGKENLLGFKHKFMRYYQVKHWTPDIAKDYLCWFLEGKASEFYGSVVARIQAIGFQEILNKLEKRFGGVPLPDTAQLQLANSKQKPEKSIDDWADRVMLLSVRAFPELPEEYMYQQVVKRICHECIDKEAGQYVVNLNLDSVEQVIDKIESF